MAKGKGSSGRKTYHVTRRPDGSWGVKGAGSKRASSTHRTQEAAQKAATRLAKGQSRGQVIVHGRDGRFRDERTYGSDPNPPTG